MFSGGREDAYQVEKAMRSTSLRASAEQWVVSPVTVPKLWQARSQRMYLSWPECRHRMVYCKVKLVGL